MDRLRRLNFRAARSFNMNPSKILCAWAPRPPLAQRVMIFRELTLDAVNRATTTLDGVAGNPVNVAKVLKALGEQPIATGFLGGDRGEFLQATLTEKGIESDFVTVSTRTRQCITVIDESAGTQTELVEESRPVEPADFVRLDGDHPSPGAGMPGGGDVRNDCYRVVR